MAKFAKGDKVVSVKSGAKGVVDEVYGEEKYAVLFDGAKYPDKVEGSQIKAANGCARNAAPLTSRNPIVQNALNSCGTARNAMGIEEAEQRAGQFVVAAKSRIMSEASTLRDSIKLLKQVRGHEDSKKIQDALMSLQWALEEVNEAVSRFK